MVEIAGVPLEIYLFSLDDVRNDSDRVVKDLYIAKEQEVWPGRCYVSAYGVLLSDLDIRDKLKKQVVGWSHSHGSLNPFFSEDDKENIVRMLETSILKKSVCVFDSTFRGEGYKGVEYKVRYSPAIVFNARNSQPFVAIAVEYTRLYDGQKVFHINEHCQLRVIDETNGIDVDPASIDKQILERCSYNGRKLEGIVGVLHKAEPKREDTEPQLIERITTPERYGLIKKAIKRLYRGNGRGRYSPLRYKLPQKKDAQEMHKQIDYKGVLQKNHAGIYVALKDRRAPKRRNINILA